MDLSPFNTLTDLCDEFGHLKTELEKYLYPIKLEQKRLATLKDILPDAMFPNIVAYGKIWLVECKRTSYDMLDTKRIQAEMSPEWLSKYQKPVLRNDLRVRLINDPK